MANWNTRKYFDDEARKRLQETITDESLLSHVISAYEYSMAAVERKEAETQEAYDNIAKLLEHTSKESGVSQETLLTITQRIAAGERNLEWYDVLGVIGSFYRIKKNMLTDKR